MIVVSATNLRNNLFGFLAKVADGETIAIHRNGENFATVVPPRKDDWRDKIRSQVRCRVPLEEAFASAVISLIVPKFDKGSPP